MPEASTVTMVFAAGKAIADAVDATKRNALLIDFQQATISAFGQLAALQMENARLQSEKLAAEQECMRLKDWSADKVGYSTRQVADGVFAEVKNDHSGDLQAAHKLCTNCFSKSVKSLLQQSVEMPARGGRGLSLSCPNGCPKLNFHYYLE